ncbi:hypothetical protein Tco_1463951, partial [Tanacetum coccineum]
EQVATSMVEFMANMNRGASGDEAGGAGAGGAGAGGAGAGGVLGWNGRIDSMCIDAANGTPWTEGDVTSSRPTGINEAVLMAYQLMGQIIQDKTGEVSEGEKRKGEGDRGGRGDNRRNYNRRQNQRRANA